jgi:hypothetical protein
MTIIRLFILSALMIVISCAEKAPIPMKFAQEAPVTVSMDSDGSELNVYMVIPVSGWNYTAVLNDDGVNCTLIVKDLAVKLGSFDTVRPIIRTKKEIYPSGFKIELTFAGRQSMEVSRNELGLHLKFTALEPDMERLSMTSFGGWAEPVTPASKILAGEMHGMTATAVFDRDPIYAAGSAGGRFFVDIFGVVISDGMLKHPKLLSVNRQEGKTRLIFSEKTDICPDENRLHFGVKCPGYSGLTGFVREKNDQTENFSFLLPGSPQMETYEAKGLVAYGFKDTKLFSRVYQRFAEGDVYKVETRMNDGMLWLVFLYTGDVRYRSYYSGDKFFVAFYRG